MWWFTPTVATPLRLSPAHARRFHRRAVLLDPPGRSLAAVLEHLAWIQIDPINVCGRMQDLILRNRVTDYREGDLMRFLHGAQSPLAADVRPAFEHHHPETGILVAFPWEAWPHLHGAMQLRSRSLGAWSGRLTPRERTLAAHILGEIAARGPLSSEDIDDDRTARKVWGSASLAKATLQKLFFHGRLLIARRQGIRRFYDLPERILPEAVRNSRPPDSITGLRWRVLARLRQRRLVRLKREELATVENLVQAIQIEGCPLLHCLNEDLEKIESTGPAETQAPLLLAPLDPLIYDRRLTSALWSFDYTWEVYTPPAKRVRGYYALPVLQGTELVGHADLKSDRERRRLTVISRSVRRGTQVGPALRSLARFLGLSGTARPLPKKD